MVGIKATRRDTAAVLSSLLSDIGSHVRYLDPAGKYVEYWMQDDGSISDYRWELIHNIACDSESELIGTIALFSVTSLIDDMLNAITELEQEEWEQEENDDE